MMRNKWAEKEHVIGVTTKFQFSALEKEYTQKRDRDGRLKGSIDDAQSGLIGSFQS